MNIKVNSDIGQVPPDNKEDTEPVNLSSIPQKKPQLAHTLL